MIFKVSVKGADGTDYGMLEVDNGSHRDAADEILDPGHDFYLKFVPQREPLPVVVTTEGNGSRQEWRFNLVWKPAFSEFI